MRALYLLLLLSISAAWADGQEILPFDDDSKRKLYQELTQQLRCPQCQNQNISESNAVVSIDMREKTYELVQQGFSKQEVIEYMVDRYGYFVHYSPPLNALTIMLWVLPVLALLFMLLFMLRRKKQQQQLTTSNAPLEQELNAIIDAYRSKK
ncbi:MAG: cytochrome c-type biogenesis protein CcmH [Alkalimonas sp.]|nr:cytochrome c-type biogenesis protein CcmH [Alkalimonas sp.]